MSYLLLNIETNESIRVDDHVWIKALATAKENYWRPGGTTYDLEYGIDDECEFIEDKIQILYRVILVGWENRDWDGNYTERRNQVVEYEDTLYMADSLRGTDTDPGLIGFIEKGSFRICSL